MMMNLLLGVGVLLLRGMMLSAIGLQTDANSILKWDASSLMLVVSMRKSDEATIWNTQPTLIADGLISYLENVLDTSF